jgi:hypothetical protein
MHHQELRFPPWTGAASGNGNAHEKVALRRRTCRDRVSGCPTNARTRCNRVLASRCCKPPSLCRKMAKDWRQRRRQLVTLPCPKQHPSSAKALQSSLCLRTCASGKGSGVSQAINTRTSHRLTCSLEPTLNPPPPPLPPLHLTCELLKGRNLVIDGSGRQREGRIQQPFAHSQHTTHYQYRDISHETVLKTSSRQLCKTAGIKLEQRACNALPTVGSALKMPIRH